MTNSPGIKERLQWVLSNYVQARTSNPFNGSQPAYQEMEAIRENLQSNLAERHPSILVKVTVGQGNWARVPWIACLDRRVTTSTQSGVYVVYLFREDMTGCYLTLAQGVTELSGVRGSNNVFDILRQRGEAILSGLPDTSGSEFSTESIDLRSQAVLPRRYEASVVLHKLYELGSLPDEATLQSDLESLLAIYEGYVESLNQVSLDPPLAVAAPNPSNGTPQVSLALSAQSLADYLLNTSRLNFTPYQIAAFITALQAKGFVLLTGISGTGKSQLAVKIAKLVLGAEPMVHPVRPDWRDSRSLLGYFNPLTGQYVSTSLVRDLLPDAAPAAPDQPVGSVNWADVRRRINERQDWQSGLEPLIARFEGKTIGELSDTDLEELWLPQRTWVASIGQAISFEFNADPDILREATRRLLEASGPGEAYISTLTFLQEHDNVWQWARVLRSLSTLMLDRTSTIADVRALRTVMRALGFDRSFNIRREVQKGNSESIDVAFKFLRDTLNRELPDLNRYQKAMAPWLIFEQLTGPPSEGRTESSAALNHKFIILDEMNLARVEYYFAEFLSVLESSRDEDGLTTQGLPLHDEKRPIKDGPPNDESSSEIPRSLRLPSHIYVIGTVNTDETTHAFSPKVLDRAFTLEFQDVDLSVIGGAQEVSGATNDGMRPALRALLARATQSERIAAQDRAFAIPTFLEWLAALNERLRPYELHFAYRVRDEIAAFVGLALESPLNDGFGTDAFVGSFDAALLMKVLPKFHGPRSQVLEPLLSTLSWCCDPENPDGAMTTLRTALSGGTLINGLDLLRRAAPDGTEHLPRTAEKISRMIYQAHTTGFAAFS